MPSLAWSGIFVLPGIECGLSDMSETAAMLRRLELIKQDGILGTMLDYEDFNYQHTLEAQSLVFSDIHSLMPIGQYPDDLRRAVEWCADACQWCTFPGDIKPSKIFQGVFSTSMNHCPLWASALYMVMLSSGLKLV